MIELRSCSPHDTAGIAAAVAGLSRGGDLIVLAGEMGAGKTAFAKGFAAELGITEPVTSPTYTLVHTFAAPPGSTRGPGIGMHHVDLYRLDHTAEVDDLALAELLDERSVMLVEWGDAVDLGPHLRVELRAVEESEEARAITISSDDPRWTARWDRLCTSVQRWIT